MQTQDVCPVCDWKIENAVEVSTKGGVVRVCCQECADKVASQQSERSEGGRRE